MEYDRAVRYRSLFLSAALTLALAVTALAQYGGPRGPFHEYPNVPYDGRFTFVRIKYQTAPRGDWYGGWPASGHGYPLSEQNLMRIVDGVTNLGPHVDAVYFVSVDDPVLFPHPI